MIKETQTPWMTTENAAAYLSVSPGTMHNWRSKGALIPWCEDLERKLDPSIRLAHWIGHEPDPWQIDAFETRTTEVALRVGRQAGKTSVLAARAVEELHIPESLTICVAPAERQAKIIAREIGRQLQRTDLLITRSTLTELEMSNGARVVALPSTSDTIRG